jgi:PAS domain S-box-containing protein
MGPSQKEKQEKPLRALLPDRDTLLKILDHMYDELFVINAKGVIIYVNRACERHYGVQPHEMIGKTIEECTEQGFWFPPVSPIALRDPKIATYEQVSNTGLKLVATVAPVFDKDGNLEMIVENLRDLPKLEEIKSDLKETLNLLSRYKQELQTLRQEELYQDFVVQSEKMKDVLKLSRQVAQVDSSVILLGETGTGKSLLAKFIHRMSSRKNESFITVNCASIPDQLIESELFGYASGAFTGANPKGKIGLLGLADGGTLVLDEISEIPLHLQAKLLQILQEKEYFPVGSTKIITIDCRILAVTNQDLRQLVDQGKFRKDLYYRLNTIEIEVPPLRKRKKDIVKLAQFFINRYDKRYKMEHQLTPEALDRLSDYTWPGNVRELEHVIERLVVTSPTQTISTEDIPTMHTKKTTKFSENLDENISLDEALIQAEEHIVSETYRKLKSSYKVASALKISQSRAYRLLKKHGLSTNSIQ